MYDALAIGATGMQAQQLNLDTIANNLANMATPGFKRARVSFSDLVIQSGLQAQRTGAEPPPLGPQAAIGAGVGVASAARQFEAGELRRTDAPMDIAIQGDGLLELAMPDGSRAYARGGSLRVNEDGQLATQQGIPFQAGIVVPEGALSVRVAGDGRVQVQVAGQATPLEAGQLELVRFANPQGLVGEGSNLYRASEASGEPIAGRAGEDGMGSFAQGFVEASNVRMVDEMVQLMVAQRAYEASVKVVQAADDMLALVNGLRR